MVFTKLAALLAASALLVADAAALPRVDANIHRTLRQQGTVNVILTMKKGTTEALSAVKESAFASRGDLIKDMVARLEQQAKDSQKEVDALLAKEAAASDYTRVEKYWITNEIFFEGATISLIEKLAALPSVASISEELVFKIPDVVAAQGNFTTLGNEWGVDKIQAPSVWADGNTGQGIIVSSIDTGVRGTHEALKANFRGAYGWFDPEKKAEAPYDNNGHGSHTMGTIAGANGIGVAPGAKWMACKGCRTSSCPQSDLLACGQFIACPTDPSGNNKDCSKAPHLVSNSWGGGQGSTTFKAMVDAWQTAGIIPIFANGNAGPECGTANSPGDLPNVIAVGATDINDGLASFSSKGPAVSGLLKPEISAPGANVRSAWFDSDAAYKAISGTSMATPHVSGAVALLLAAKPGIKYEDVRSALIKGVDTATLKPAGKTCGGTSDGTFPNNNFGYGRLNIKSTIGGSTPPTPTTQAPVPTTQAPVPTTQAPKPTTQAPKPTTQAPKPTTPAPITPKPTTAKPTAAPNKCAGLSFSECWDAEDCYWSWWAGECRPY
ncbi:hypothetical protein PINS_up004178 [Pythium insidiosum]|nr:hypothetical protein PINS_up004177 [Pythium insidiosum]GLD95501.1 hypothetical protein PINS_up004178 [Pythium insidiosum]